MEVRINATLFCIILITMNMFSQELHKEEKCCIIKYDMISLLGDQVSPSVGVRAGLEWMNGEGQSLNADIMYIFPCNKCGEAYTRIETEKTVGFLISAEFRFYLYPGSSAFGGFHLGPQLAYQYTIADIEETNNGISNIFQVYRNMFTAHGMAGYQVRVAGPLYLDPSLGVGIRYISSHNENKKVQESVQHEFMYNKKYETGSKWFPSFDISIKLGIKL